MPAHRHTWCFWGMANVNWKLQQKGWAQRSMHGTGDEGGQKSPMERAHPARIPITKHECCSYFTHVSPDISFQVDKANFALYTTMESRHEQV